MSSDNSGKSGFHITWGDKEIEYFGESSKDLFIIVFDFIKTIPAVIPVTKPVIPIQQDGGNLITENPATDIVDFDGYKRISVDIGVPIEQVKRIITFEKRLDFPELVPILTVHPDDRDAVRLIAYAMQVGLQQQQIDLGHFKKVLSGPNNYQFPGSTLGFILADFRKSNFVSASTAQGRNRPFNLTKTGLDMARDFIKKQQ